MRHRRTASSTGCWATNVARPDGCARRRLAWRQQAILGRGRWDAEALRDIVRDYAIDHLGTDDAVLVIDETGFLKQGKASCGVARQYTGSAGKVTNCQIGVFAAYVSVKGPCLRRPGTVSAKELDRRPFTAGGGARARRHGLRNQADTGGEDDRTLDGGKHAVFPARGGCGLRCRRHRAGAASCRQRVRAGRKGRPSLRLLGRQAGGRGHRRTDRKRPRSWRMASPVGRQRHQGARLHDWACLEFTDLEANDYADDLSGTWTRGLLSDATSPMAISPSSRRGARPARP